METAKRNIPLSRGAANDIHPLAERPTFSTDQLNQYLTHLHRTLPSTSSRLTLQNLRTQIEASPLKAISTLMRLHLSSIPWGNLSLHYSTHHTISITPPSHVFNKLITRNHGGYCMEQNLLFATILRSLGYAVYLTGARISNALDLTGAARDKEGYSGWGHMVLFVTHPSISGERYLVDVGFGSGNALSPIPLADGAEVPCQPGQKGRIVRRRLAASTQVPKQEMWVYQNKIEGKEDVGEEGWTNAYCFGEGEWFEEDFVANNFKTSRSLGSWFTWMFVMTRMILGGDKAAGRIDGGEKKVNGEKEGEAEVVGSVTIFGANLTRRLSGGQSEVLRELKSEEERVEALKEWFGIELADEEREGIRGMVTGLKG